MGSPKGFFPLTKKIYKLKYFGQLKFKKISVTVGLNFDKNSVSLKMARQGYNILGRV